MSSSRSDIVRHEIKTCAIVAEKYPKNYYAWTHRLYLWSLFFHNNRNCRHKDHLDLKIILLEEEMNSMWSWLHIHPSDHSAVHYLGAIIEMLLSSKTTYGIRTDTGTIERIQNNVNDLVNDHGDHESIWILRRITSKILWEQSYTDQVKEQAQSVVADIKRTTSCPNREAQMVRRYGLTFLAWCYSNLQGPIREELLSTEDTQMIIDEMALTNNDEVPGQEFWMEAGSRLLHLTTTQ
jgi:Protein prenyltransferase alpha subunit repeat